MFDTASDAFDSDFSEGVVDGGRFSAIGKAGTGAPVPTEDVDGERRYSSIMRKGLTR